MIQIYQGDNLEVMRELPRHSFDLIYTDPPFGTGETQALSNAWYGDWNTKNEYIEWLTPRLEMAYDLLKPDGTLYLHLDHHMVHYIKVRLDTIFSDACFINEIIWAYDYGGRSTKRWPTKHDTILMYAKNSKNYHFDIYECDRIPYMAPGLVGEVKAARGKTPTDVWWHTIVHTTGRERVGYPTQKPLGIVERIIKVSSRNGDRVLDMFAGSGTTGVACANHNRECVLIDNNPQAIEVMCKRMPTAELMNVYR